MEIVNRVAQSSLTTIDVEQILDFENIVDYDLTQNLERGFILREKDFREFLKKHDWSQYQNKYVRLHCTSDAIVPKWAFLLLSTRLKGQAIFTAHCDQEVFRELLAVYLIDQYLAKNDFGTRIVVKGCSKTTIPDSVYTHLVWNLQDKVDSISFGEPCSTVPIFKKPRPKRAI